MSSTADNSMLHAAGRSWREIRQEVQPRAMSRKGRRRQQLGWFKAGLLFTSMALAAWGIYEIVYAWETDRTAVTTAVHSDPVRGLEPFVTDGVLTKEWVDGVLHLPRNSSLMSLDLVALRNRLLSYGQVRGVVLTRNFPDKLGVTLQERTPVARVQAADASGHPQQLLVAKDGVVYEGINCDLQMLGTLSFLDGIKLMRSASGFRPIEGMDVVSDLLATAQLQAPHLYRGWQVVSLARLADAGEIVVRSQEIPAIVFSRREDYFRQLSRLDYVMDAMKRLPEPAIKTVNLALGSQVPLTPERPPQELLQFQPTIGNQSKGKRAL